MNSEPRVSVIMAAYNAEKYLREAVDSILSQTLADFELIVVDDASTDGTRAILASYSDPRIRVLHNPSNAGQSVSRNRALAAARGKYIAVLDADDLAVSTRLERQAEWLDSRPDFGLLAGCAVTIDEQGNEQERWGCPLLDLEIKWELMFRNVFFHSSVMMRKSTLDDAGAYSNEDCIRRAFVEDYELLSRVSRCTKAAVLPEVLAKYRVHSEGASVRTGAEQGKRADEVARRNMAWLIGAPVSDFAWESLVRLKLNWAPLSAEEARTALALNEAIHEAFARRYLQPESARRRLRDSRLFWARRAFAQARRNPYLDHRCRSLMLVNTAKLLAQACVPMAG